MIYLLLRILLSLYLNGLIKAECNDSCHENSALNKESNCFCNGCDVFNDCCASEKVSQPDVKPKFECNIRTSHLDYTYSVVTCADWWLQRKNDDKTRAKCESPTKDIAKLHKNIFNLVPVYDPLTGTSYRNIFCAKCNVKHLQVQDIKFYKLQPNMGDELFYELWNTKNKSQTAELLVRYLQLKQAKSSEFIFSLNSTKVSLRKCYKPIRTCLAGSSNALMEQCSNHTALRFDNRNQLIYQNKYCARCNNVSRSLDCELMQQRINHGSLQLLFDLSDLYAELYEDMNSLRATCQPNQLTRKDLIKKHATIICLTVSIGSISVLLIIYFLNKSLRNFPGKLLICLSVSLLLSQLLFLISTYTTESAYSDNSCDTTLNNNSFIAFRPILVEMSKPCYLAGMLMHYFYLANFAWSNVMGYDLYRIFVLSASNHKDIDINMRFLKYFIYGWATPLLILFVMVCKQFWLGTISYGFNHCFISGQIDTLIFFIVPIAVILTSNLLFLLFSICSIRKVDRMCVKYLVGEEDKSLSKKVDPPPLRMWHFLTKIFHNSHKHPKRTGCLKDTRGSEKKRLTLFLKLFVLTGLTWILGLVSSLQKESFLWYIYIVANSLQGLFIFVSFAFSTSTKRELKKSSIYKTLSLFVVSTKSESSSNDAPSINK